jgi:tRNA A37 methylthiotransferase MiaB
VLGCMAERLKARLLDRDKLADLVVGPDAYRDLPRILDAVRVGLGAGAVGVGGDAAWVEAEAKGTGRGAGTRRGVAAAHYSPPSPPLAQAGAGGSAEAMNVALSLEETYADLVPLRRAGAASAFVSIMRGCNNMWGSCV